MITTGRSSAISFHRCRLLMLESRLLIAVLCFVIGAVQGFSEEEDEEFEPDDLSTAQIHAFLKEKFVEAYEELKLAEREDPIDDYQDALERAEEFIHEYQEIASHDREGAKLFLEIGRGELAVQKLALRFDEAKTEKERSTIRSKLAEGVTALFDLEIKAEQRELKALKKEVADIEALITERLRNRDALIAEELGEYLEEGDEEEEED